MVLCFLKFLDLLIVFLTLILLLTAVNSTQFSEPLYRVCYDTPLYKDYIP